jgi:chemotaxis protein MotB
MARKAAWEDLVSVAVAPYEKNRGTRSARLFAALLLIASVTFVAAYYLPLYRAHQKLGERWRELVESAQGLSARLTKSDLELKATAAQKDQLQAEHDALEAKTTSDAEQLERMRAVLAPKLDKLVKKGNAALLVRGRALFVVLDGALLFMPQKVDMFPAARALLCDVVKTSGAKSVTIADSLAPVATVPPAFAANYPSAWALSGARAAVAAQVLARACSFSTSELRATGNGGHDPLAELSATKFLGDHLELELALP